MSNIKRFELDKQVYLNSIESKKFKTNFISCCFVSTISKESAFLNALVPFVLKRGSKNYPDMKSINLKLLDLYGAKLSAVIRKKGNNQIVEIAISFVDDKYALNNESILNNALDIFFDVIFNPILSNGHFNDQYVTAEKENLVDLIYSRENDKRLYAEDKCISTMCKDEPFGIPETGFKEDAQKVTAISLYNSYYALINTSRIEFFVLGNTNEAIIQKAIKDKLSSIGRQPQYNEIPAQNMSSVNINEVTEQQKTNQCKLSLGMRIKSNEQNQFAVMLFNSVYGSTPVSKLFMNVREKLSLCYYCSSKIDRNAGVLTVNSGIEARNKDKAVNEIINQLDNMKKGDFTDEDITAAKLFLINSIKSAWDNQSQIEDWYLSQLNYNFVSMQDACNNIEKVTKKEIIDITKTVAVDTIFFLKGE